MRALSGHGCSSSRPPAWRCWSCSGCQRTARDGARCRSRSLATAAVPWLAFLDGHPYRIRYMVPLLAAQAIGAGVAAGCVERVGRAVAVALVLAVAVARTAAARRVGADGRRGAVGPAERRRRASA